MCMHNIMYVYIRVKSKNNRLITGKLVHPEFKKKKKKKKYILKKKIQSADLLSCDGECR